LRERGSAIAKLSLLVRGGGVYRAAAANWWKAAMNSPWLGQLSLIANFTRRTLTRTTAPIFSNRRRIV
jgi:hypothetical protein